MLRLLVLEGFYYEGKQLHHAEAAKFSNQNFRQKLK